MTNTGGRGKAGCNKIFKRKWCSRNALVKLGLLGLFLSAGGCIMFRMPGKSYKGPLPPLDEAGASLEYALKRDVGKLADEIGERNMFAHAALLQAAGYIEDSLKQAGYRVARQEYEVYGSPCWNIEAERTGTSRKDEIVIVGAHYDSVEGSPGANDNATGVAALLALARAFADKTTSRTVRFVAFVNEEPPFFQTENMGSLVYARRCREREENVIAMLSLETIGYYSDTPGSQRYPFPFSLFYPSTGNYIGFLGDISSRRLVRRCVASFRKHAQFPSEGGAITSLVPEIGFSDHWSFWNQGYRALMATDTAFCRYAYYHTQQDTADNVQYDNLARVVQGLEHVIEDLAMSP